MQTDHSLSIQDKVKVLEGFCRKAGLKLTHQRLEIYRELASTYDHPSADDVYKRVQERMPTISIDTVYRTLLTFEQFGLATRVHAFDDKARFDTNVSPHQHLACIRCKSIQDFDWEAFDQMKPPDKTKQWGEVESKYAVLKGICKECLKKDRKKATKSV
jgi:Fur family peroxide stress response transcriptional regulator